MKTYAILVQSDKGYNTTTMKSTVLKYFKDEKIKCFKTNLEAIDLMMKDTYFKKTYNTESYLISHDAIKSILFNSGGGLFFIQVQDGKKAKSVVNELILNLNCTVRCEEFDNSYFEPTGSNYKKTISYVHMKKVEHQSTRYETVHNLFGGTADYNELGKLGIQETAKLLKEKSDSYRKEFYDSVAVFIRLVYELNNDVTNY